MHTSTEKFHPARWLIQCLHEICTSWFAFCSCKTLTCTGWCIEQWAAADCVTLQLVRIMVHNAPTTAKSLPATSCSIMLWNDLWLGFWVCLLCAMFAQIPMDFLHQHFSVRTYGAQTLHPETVVGEPELHGVVGKGLGCACMFRWLLYI